MPPGPFLYHRFNRFGGFNEEAGASLPVPTRGPAVRHPGAQHQVDRFALSYRDVEDLLAEQRLELNYETVRRRVLKFGPAGARRLRRQPPCPSSHWHVGEMVFRVGGERLYLWRAVDNEGAVLVLLVQRRGKRATALNPIRRLPKKQGLAPTRLTTDRLRFYGVAFAALGLTAQHPLGLKLNNRAEVSYRRRQTVRRDFGPAAPKSET